MNLNQVLNVGMRIRATKSFESHYKFGEEFEIVNIGAGGDITLDHCECGSPYSWSSHSIRTSFELIAEEPITPEEMAKAVSLPDPEDALKFFKR
jgi:hypothetical protein